MGYIWDYFMRRKGLLLAIIAVFTVSSILSYQALTSNAKERETPYIEIEDWGESIEVPRTGDEIKILAIMDAKDVVQLPELEVNEFEAEVLEESVAEADRVETENKLMTDDGESRNNTEELGDPLVVIDTPQLGEIEVVQDEYVELAIEEPKERKEEGMNVVLIVLGGIAVLALGGYLTYQHFMR